MGKITSFVKESEETYQEFKDRVDRDMVDDLLPDFTKPVSLSITDELADGYRRVTIVLEEDIDTETKDA